MRADLGGRGVEDRIGREGAYGGCGDVVVYVGSCRFVGRGRGMELR